MSHVADVDLKITDLDAFKKACDALGLVVIEGQTTWKWFGQWMNDYSDPNRAAASRGFAPEQFGHGDHAVRFKDAASGDYELGLVPRRDGGPGWELLYDNYASGTKFARQLGGPGLANLKDEYGAAVAETYWQKKGYTTRREMTADNKMQVIAWAH